MRARARASRANRGRSSTGEIVPFTRAHVQAWRTGSPALVEASDHEIWAVTAGLRGSHYRRDRRGPVPGSAAGARGARLLEVSARSGSSIRPLGRGDAHADQARRGLGPGHRGAARRRARPLPHGLGDPDALAHRHGGGPRRLPRSEPVARPLRREPEHRQALVDVLLRPGKRPEDDVLPALAPGGDSSGCPGAMARRIRSISWSFRTCKSSPISALTTPRTYS